MEALNDLITAGKVRAIGASAMYGYQFYNMQLAAKDNGWAGLKLWKTITTFSTGKMSGN